MAEAPPLNRIYVFGYSANDRDYPIVSLTADPRVAGYQVPKDLSACPDKRYPNHVFTGAQPIAGDQRVRHVWEILPSPWVPFTRYDDDLGPVQGRRRSVKNEGQVASLTADKRTTYEAREGSAIVYTEIEESWSIKVDEDGNSLFPIRDRDFYDPSRGPVQERRQLFVPTGEEEGSLENVNGVITQTSYEPYNEFLSVKIVQTYKVDGPQLIGKATNNEGQVVTVTTQRKGAKDYVAPNPTATKTVEASREDAESLVERITEVPEVFAGENYQKTKADLTPQKFRAAQEDTTFEQTIEGIAEPPTLATGEFAKSEQQITKFLKRISTTSRITTEATTLSEKVLTPEGQVGTRTLTLDSGDQSFEPSATLIDANVEALGDGRTVKTETTVPQVFKNEVKSIERPDNVPQKFRATIPTETNEKTEEGIISIPELELGDLAKSEQQVTEFVKRTRTTTRASSVEPKQPFADTDGGKIPENAIQLKGAEFTSELGGGFAEVTETYPFVKLDEYFGSVPQFGTISNQIENLGDGTVINRKVVLEDVPQLSGQEYDENIDVVIPYRQYIADAGNPVEISGGKKRVTPRDVIHSLVVEYDVVEFENKIKEVFWKLPEMVRITLPDKLKSAKIEFERDNGESSGEGVGDTYFLQKRTTRSSSAELSYTIEKGFSENIPATRCVFFLKNNEASSDDVLFKIRTKFENNSIKYWPHIRLQEEQVVITSRNTVKDEQQSVSFDSVSTSESTSSGLDVRVSKIPPTLHKEIVLYDEGFDGFPVLPEVGTTVKPSILDATEYVKFPIGKYIYQVNSSPFRLGFIRIEAIVVDVTVEYV